MKFQAAFHILIDPIVRQTSSCLKASPDLLIWRLKESVLMFVKTLLCLAFPQILYLYELFQ